MSENKNWSKVTVLCYNRSVKVDYNISKSDGSKAIIAICGGKKTGGFCPKLLHKKEGPLQGSKVFHVSSPALDEYDYTAAVYGSKPKVRILKKKFNFKSCTKALQTTSSTWHVEVSESQLFSTTDQDTVSDKNWPSAETKLILSISGIAVFVILLIFILVWFIRKKRHKNFQDEKKHSANSPLTVMKNEKPKRVYVVFANDNGKHMEIVLAFASYLSRDLGFHVAFELWEKLKASQNFQMWMKMSLEEADKVLVIWSSTATELMKEPKSNHSNSTDMFSPVVRHIQSDMFAGENINKYLFAYFNYSESNCIPQEYLDRKKFPCYQLMQDMEALYFSLTDTEKHQPGRTLHNDQIMGTSYFKSPLNKDGLWLKNAIHTAANFPENSTGITDNRSDTESESDSGRATLKTSILSFATTITPSTDINVVNKNLLHSSSVETTELMKPCISIASIAQIDLDSDPMAVLQGINKKTLRRDERFDLNLWTRKTKLAY